MTKLSPKKTLYVLAIVLLLAVSILFDLILQKRCNDIFFSIVNSSQQVVRAQHYLGLLNNFRDAMKEEAFIESVVIFDGDFHKLANLGVPHGLPFSLLGQTPARQIFHVGIFKYALIYQMPHNPDLILVVWFYQQNWLYYFLIAYVCSLFAYGLLLLGCNRIDYEENTAKATAQAVEYLSLGFHEMKQFVAYTGELIKYLKTRQQIEKDTEKTFIQDYNNLSISVASMMSIIHFTDKRAKISSDDELLGAAEQFCVQEAIETCLRSYSRRDIHVECMYEHRSYLHLKKAAFYAIIGNIIKNAFCYSNKMVWIITQESDQGIVVTVANTGKEIPVAQQREMLQAKLVSGGKSGLGLLIVNLWCQKIGATLTLHSSKMGTEFTVRFPGKLAVSPLVQNNIVGQDVPGYAATASVSSLDVDQGNAKRIAVIDDIETFCIGICKELKSHGYQATSFSNLNSFLDVLKKKESDFHCVIVDRHGVGFDAVKDRFPEACRYYNFAGKIILFSSNAEHYLLDEYRAKGFDQVLAKSQVVDWPRVIEA